MFPQIVAFVQQLHSLSLDHRLHGIVKLGDLQVSISPLICRLFGTTPSLPCPNGARPVYMIDPRTEREIHDFLARTRQVLV